MAVAGEPAVAPDRGGMTASPRVNVSPAAPSGERCRSAAGRRAPTCRTTSASAATSERSLMSDQPTVLGGTCSARFDPLRELFAAKLESGEDLGASLVFNVDGEVVVDLWGGWADEARTVPWN